MQIMGRGGGCLLKAYTCMYLQGETSRGHWSPFLAHQNEGGGGELMLYPRGQHPYLVNVFVAGPVHMYISI